ncbi:MAG TPA: TIGR03960 family B12-binding radical SAM protein, partial [Dehalococcoidia bacterium]|nr:TIGR03960 family B12-binding radical SAM protein [Dehalococcoidia bacterium]
LDRLRDWKRRGRTASRKDRLGELAAISGIYVPSLYHVEYHADGLIRSVTPTAPEARPVISRRIVTKLPPPVTRPVVPYIEVVHDRGAIEIQRGCSRGCRFCQAGTIYRPVRERPRQEVIEAVGELISGCGYNEVSLVSLCTNDYPGIDRLIDELARHYRDLTISLPSLRIDRSSVTLVDSLPTRRKTGLTFAPEAGSQRLQRVINKVTPEEVLLETAAAVFDRGWTNLKLYFMLGLPTETNDDINDIVHLVEKVRTLDAGTSRRQPQIRISLSTFVPKPHTPFQWVPQDSEAQLTAKHEILKAGLKRKRVKPSWPDPRLSLLEAVMSRGDRRLGRVIHRAWKLGSTFDAWGECFRYENWLSAFTDTNLEPGFYAHRERSLDEVLPWGHIDSGVTVAFLEQEYHRATGGELTNDCRRADCNVCGVQRWHKDCQNKQARS